MIFLWTEDRENKSGFQFWETISNNLFSGIIKVESKNNNGKLVQSVCNLKDKNNIYLIAFDNAFDNNNANILYTRLCNEVENRKNVFILNMYSFEYILLSFSKLRNWVFEDESQMKSKEIHLKTRDALVKLLSTDSTGSYKDVQIIKDYFNSGLANVGNIEKYTIESFSSKLLYNITRNTDFFVDKSNLGTCWKESCCNLQEKMCGIPEKGYSKEKKARILLKNSCLSDIFNQIDILNLLLDDRAARAHYMNRIIEEDINVNSIFEPK